MNIGERLKELRLESGISISKLSKLSGVSSGYISEVEKDLKSPSVEILKKLLSALKISFGTFFNESKGVPLKPIVKTLIDSTKDLSEDDLQLILQLIKRLK